MQGVGPCRTLKCQQCLHDERVSLDEHPARKLLFNELEGDSNLQGLILLQADVLLVLFLCLKLSPLTLEQCRCTVRPFIRTWSLRSLGSECLPSEGGVPLVWDPLLGGVTLRWLHHHRVLLKALDGERRDDPASAAWRVGREAAAERQPPRRCRGHLGDSRSLTCRVVSLYSGRQGH